MNEAEPDASFRDRIWRVANESDRPAIAIAKSHELDAYGRKYDRFRYGVSLSGEDKKPAEIGRTKSPGRANHYGAYFAGMHFDMTGGIYVGCTFRDCVLEARPSDPPLDERSNFYIGCTFIGDGWPDRFKTFPNWKRAA